MGCCAIKLRKLLRRVISLCVHCDPGGATPFLRYAEVEGAGAAAGAGAGAAAADDSLEEELELVPGGVVAELPPLESVL